MNTQANVPWKDLKFDIFLIFLPILLVTISLVIDVCNGQSKFFQRSGSLLVIVSVYLGARSLTKFWNKVGNSFGRGYWASVSPNQAIIDKFGLFWALIGTLIGGYGDLLFNVVYKCITS